MNFDLHQLWLSSPLLVVTVGALVLLLLESFTEARPTQAIGADQQPRAYLGAIAILFLAIAGACAMSQWDEASPGVTLYNGSLVVDRFSIFLNVTFYVGAALSVMLGGGFMREQRFEFGEFYALILLATAGMSILVQALDLVSVFIGVEAMSLAVYVLTGSWRRSAKSSEAALKYFLVGAFASAVLIYGIALVYGTTGTTNVIAIASIGKQGATIAGAGAAAQVLGEPLFLIGTFFISAAFAFKVAAVPFHLWAPDAYEGAPTPVTAFMAAGVKAAAFGGLVRLFATAFGRPDLTFGAGGWASLAAVLAMVTMTLGNVVALRQENIKRMLAYSSISHAGYLLVGVAAMGVVGAEARGPILYYLLAYTLTTVGSFGVVAWYGAFGDERLLLDDWAGLAQKSPIVALGMTILLLSLGGFPPTAGFFGKFYVFRAALAKPGLVPVVIVAVLNSVVSVFYYLRPIVAMYFREPGREVAPISSAMLNAAIVIAVVGTLVLGLYPSPFIELANQAALYLPVAK